MSSSLKLIDEPHDLYGDQRSQGNQCHDPKSVRYHISADSGTCSHCKRKQKRGRHGTCSNAAGVKRHCEELCRRGIITSDPGVQSTGLTFFHESFISVFSCQIQDSLASLGAGFGSALADIIHLRIPAQPRGAYIRWGIDTRH